MSGMIALDFFQLVLTYGFKNFEGSEKFLVVAVNDEH